MSFVAVDPGTTESAIVHLGDDLVPISFGKWPNRQVRTQLIGMRDSESHPIHLAIEMVQSYGFPVGREVFEAVVWIGRFVEAWGGPHTFVYRKDVTSHLCHSGTAKDSNVRAALIDLYGGKSKAIGLTKSRGPLYGVSNDVWSALAVGVTWKQRLGPIAERHDA